MTVSDSQLLAIDAGNSRVKLVLFKGTTFVRSEWVVNNPNSSADEWADHIGWFVRGRDGSVSSFKGSVLSSVTPHSTPAILDALQRCELGPVLEVSASVYPHRILYDDPTQVGADRLCDAAGGFQRAHGAVIVVDFGTAVTLNAVSEEGDFLGGVIIPGPAIASSALSVGTAQLPTVLPKFPQRVIGTDTAMNLASGLTHGWVGMVDGLVQSMETEMGGMVSVLATGGGGVDYAKASKRIESYYPHLTLEGAAAIFRNWKESN